MAKKRKNKYDDSFRREAIRLLESRGDRTVEDVAASLGVSVSMLYRWKGKFGSDATGDEVEGSGSTEEVSRLRKRVRELEMERDILKKATAFFAKESR